MTHDDPRRRIPRTDALLATLGDLVGVHGVDAVKAAVTTAQADARSGRITPEDVESATRAVLAARTPTTLHPLVNATGVVLHTNIGRAALSADARRALLAAAGHVDVEFDLGTGARARRGRGTLAALREAVPAAGDVLAVNNGAAALVLATTALAVAQGRPEIVMSRGEIVEIGDNFRLHELIESTGATIVEVGTTNRTWAQDYSRAVTEWTGLVVKVHPSNFVVHGFTHGVDVPELSRTLADVRAERGLDVPLLADIGSGLLRPEPLLPDEPDAHTALTGGADLVTASGDKLLGGPQAGLVLGRADLVEAMRRSPLARAVRVDKLALAALEATLRGGPTPTAAALRADVAELRRRTEEFARRLAEQGVGGRVVAHDAAVGGGGAPGVVLPSVAVALPDRWGAPLRREGVVAQVTGGACLVDLRGVEADDEARLLTAILTVAHEGDAR
ncbi:L-seryl-tRNA(Sec) selenium transferase [Mobilicoccus pelagius]|uniref:L-seryl-tRNA(Sec) selenium transferase n=1 Tax=Mobilicoccus pelagius NBRC 104925 TaxID=1089455 RepID=H5URE9_9MICO|nr:L-seryl-tRNA(Sec) selenium transferase [Mobilicoccus pelagius]GAB48307.1 L-seryl-tRNA(Sec) selenium transferase [Mobilicoccus pelagius NBRC 104925]